MVAIAKELEKHNDTTFEFAVAKNNSDKYLVENEGYSYSEFSVAKLRRYFSWENFRDFFIFFKNIWKATFFLKKNRPDKIFSKGGFVSLPIGIAAKILSIPFYLHETDKTMGLSNKILSRFATKIFTGFPSSNPNHIFVGNPVREEFFILPKQIPLTSKKNVLKVLIFGGSQGALALNAWAREFFLGRNEEVLLITGKGKLSKKKSDPLAKNITEVEFLMKDFCEKIHEADIIITRAGGSVSELSAAQKMVVLVPLPSSANDHQRANAKFFADKNAAVYIEEEDLYTDETKKVLEEIFLSPERRKEYEKNIAPFAQKNSVEKICKEILGE